MFRSFSYQSLSRELVRKRPGTPVRRALPIYEAAFGANHRNVSGLLGDLAKLLHRLDCPAEADPLYRRALAIEESSVEPANAVVAATLSNMALCLADNGQTEEAEAKLLRVLEIESDLYGSDDIHLVTTLANLASVLYSGGRLEETAAIQRRSAVIFERFRRETGQEDPNASVGLMDYVRVLKELGLNEAEVKAQLVEIFS